MKKFILLVFLSFVFAIGFSQTPGVVSTKYISNWFGDEELIYDSKIGINGGYIIVGVDTGYSYNKSRALTKNFVGRPWIAKLDNTGNKIWSKVSQKVSPYQSAFTSVCLSPSGNYVAAGYGNSPSNFFVSAYNSSGTFMWDTLYGGSGIDRAFSVQPTPDGGYILAGITTSNDGLVTGNHSPGIADIWLVKIDAGRAIQWKKCYGGSGADTAYAILPTPDNGFVVAGSSTSANGDLTGNNGLSDGWVFKTDNAGNIIWQKNIGGTGHEAFRSIVTNSDDSYTLTGYTGSASVPANGIKGRSDVWLIKVSGTNGNTIWSKGFGGTRDDQGFSLQRTLGNGYFIGGFTESYDGDITNRSGGSDTWLLNVDSDGSLIWQKTAGVTKSDYATTAHYISENDYVVTGFAGPPVDGGDSTDGYFVRLGNTAHLKGSLISPRLINSGVVRAVKANKEYSTVPVNGTFWMDVDTGTYTISYDPQSQYYTSTVPVVRNILAYYDTAIANFNVTALPGKRDLGISAAALTVARPGFNVSYRLFYKNAGTDTITAGQIIFKKDSKLNFLSAVPALSSFSGDTLKWNFNNLKPFDSTSITINMTVQSPPIVNINDTLLSFAIVTPVGDPALVEGADTVLLKQRVQGSYDPNDKTENLAGRISVQQVSVPSYINYLVRFQNTGNDTAFNISIRDTLDQKLDWSSLQMVSSSHPYQLNIKTQNQLTWTFKNIKLVDSIRNESASHGFIAYRIKPKSNLVIGDVIKNTASIYFDFNLPVRTNTQETAVVNNAPLVTQPVLTSFTPAAAGSGATVTITGTSLTGATAVNFGSAAASSFTVSSPTSITAVVGAGASGNVSVTTAGGTATLAGFTFIPSPTIASFTPTSGGTGASVTITGTNLTGATAVTFGGLAASSFTVSSPTSITAVVGGGVSGNISVTTTGGTATLAGFTFIPSPTITSFTPTSGGSASSVTITGTNFTGVTAVSFGGIAATSFTVNSATSITAITGIGASGNVTVTTAGGTATLAGFTFIPSPTITSFTPTSGGTATSITITGTNFTGATAVSFGGIVATSFTVNTATSITAVVGIGVSGDVSVTTAGGTAILSGFAFIPAPTITSFTPTSGGTATSITITGTNFTGATAISFGGITAASFTVNSAASITAVVGSGASGNVSVLTPGGTATVAGFTFTVVTALDPVPAGRLGIRFYPNPTTGSFVIDTLKLSDKWETLEIFDAQGKKKLSNFPIRNKTRLEVNVDYLARGIYMAFLKRKTGPATVVKFLKL